MKKGVVGSALFETFELLQFFIKKEYAYKLLTPLSQETYLTFFCGKTSPPSWRGVQSIACQLLVNPQAELTGS